MKKQSVEYYLSKGFDQKTAEYFFCCFKEFLKLNPVKLLYQKFFDLSNFTY